MPIKFRCVHCNKLLGIARRKAGTVVECPQCTQQLIVPTPQEPEHEQESDQPTIQPEPAPKAGGQRLFEQDNFDLVLQERDAPTYRANDDQAPTYAPQPFPVERHLPAPPVPAPMPYPAAPAPPLPSGIVLSGGKIMLLLVVIFFLLAGAFGAGIVVGKSLNVAS